MAQSLYQLGGNVEPISIADARGRYRSDFASPTLSSLSSSALHNHYEILNSRLPEARSHYSWSHPGTSGFHHRCSSPPSHSRSSKNKVNKLVRPWNAPLLTGNLLFEIFWYFNSWLELSGVHLSLVFLSYFVFHILERVQYGNNSSVCIASYPT